MNRPNRPLFDVFPALADATPFVSLGEFPTPVERLLPLARTGGRLFAKRDDRSSPIYGGNKVRTLEGLFGDALAGGSTTIHSTGAYGTNHGLAAILHAPRVGLTPGVIAFPQPVSACALENLRVMLSLGPVVRDLPHWSALPFGMLATRRADRREGVASTIMLPGGASPIGGLGYVNAGLELARQVSAGELPRPDRIVVGVGSTCTSAGLLVGLRLAAQRGIGFSTPPLVHSVRVTPWPVTSRFRIVSLAVDIAAFLAAKVSDRSLAYRSNELSSGLAIDGSEIGFGYGFPTKRGRLAIHEFRDALGWELDTTYSAKAAAAATRVARDTEETVLFWSTKSTAKLPEVRPDVVAGAPPRMKRWMARAERAIAKRVARGLVPG